MGKEGERPSSRLGKAAPVLCIAAALLASLALEPYDTWRLLISDGEGRRLAAIDLPDGRFDHVFIHSINLTPVEERFRIEADETEGGGLLRLYELRYESTSVGMPSDAEGGYRLEGGRFILSMDRSLKKIPLRVSIVPGHGIVAGGVFRPFTDWARQEGLLVLSGERAFAIRLRR